MHELVYGKRELSFLCCGSRRALPGSQQDIPCPPCVEFRYRLAIAAVATLVAASACSSGAQTAAVRDEAQYIRVDREIATAERFAALKRACRNENGVVQVRRMGSRVPVKSSEMDTAICVRRFD